MTLAGCCRNCLAGWSRKAAAKRGIDIRPNDGRLADRGMPGPEVKVCHQAAASQGRLAAFETARRST